MGDVVMRPMTSEEWARALAFGKCSFPIASFVKRFARDLRAQAMGSGNISERQAERLRIEVYRYRRQMPKALVPAEEPEGYRKGRVACRKAVATVAPVVTVDSDGAHPEFAFARRGEGRP